MKYKIAISKNAQKSLAKIPKVFQQKIISSIKELSFNPHPQNSKKLTNRLAWRIRINNYRVIYEIDEEILTISIIVISHRRNVYQKC